MAQITAAIVKELRERTGAGMMDCKKALVATEGDMEKAIDFLREKGLSQAAKKAGRVAAEGAVVAYVTEDGKTGAIVEVDVDALLASEMDGKTVKDVVTEAIAKIGENISVRRFVRYESAEGKVYSYIHGGGKIGVLVDMKGGDAELGKDIAMQVAAANPQFLNRNEVPDSELEHEKDILTEQARNEGKPENIIAKMVMGRINKYYKEVCLVDQEFIRDGDLTISKLLKSKNADVARFARFQLGEGIEKKQENFADEVAAFIKK